jgi:acyl-CoA synthetase (AMP-forming)/AMP-acid ligase II
MGGATRLPEDLGIDSLTMVQVILRIEAACGYAPAPAELRTVADVALLLLNKARPASLPVLAEVEAAPIRIPPLVPIHELFSRRGDVTDLTLGEHFPRSALMGYAKAVSTLLHDLPCRRLGIALPAGAAAMAAFAGCLGAGRTPVMLNYSMGSAQLEHCARLTEVTHVLTSRRMYGRGMPPGAEAVYLEDVDTSRLGRTAFASMFGFDWFGDVNATAVILFTSGSESQPKAVPLTHRNLMSNLRDILSVCLGEPLNVRRMSLLCCLPGFHSLGFLSNMLLPLVCGVPSVCIADPSNSPALARAAVAYKTSMFVTTPTFLHGLLHAAQEPLPFRQVVLGAESCPQSTRELFAERCPEGRLIEGYGVTECSPVIALNVEDRPGSVGCVLPGLEYRIYEDQLHVRGESVFAGYLDGRDPRVRISASAHADWYPTGDFCREEAGALYFWDAPDAS